MSNNTLTIKAELNHVLVEYAGGIKKVDSDTHNRVFDLNDRWGVFIYSKILPK